MKKCILALTVLFCMVLGSLIQPNMIAKANTKDTKDSYEFTSKDTLVVNDEKYDVEKIKDRIKDIKHIIVNTDQIDLYSFSSFPMLETITISKNTKNIYLFPYGHDLELPTLKEIIVDKDNPAYESYEGALYTKSLHKLLYYPVNGKKEVTLPKATTVIQKKAFKNVPITKVNFSNEINLIEEEAFANTKLTTISLPESFVVIKKNAFKDSSLKAVQVSTQNENLCSVDGAVYTKDLRQLYYWPEDKIEDDLKLPEGLVYLDCSKIRRFPEAKSITIPKTLTAIVNAKTNRLQTIHITEGNPCFKLYDGVMYSSNEKQIRLYPNQNPDTKIELNPKLECLRMELFETENTTTSLTLPKNLREIYGEKEVWENVLLGGFTHLSELKLQGSNKNYTLVDGVLYNKDKTSLVWYPIDLNKKSFEIPASVKTIVNDQLVKQNHLEKLTISKQCKIFDYSKLNGDYVWYYEMPVGRECKNLKEFIVARDNKYYSADHGVLFTKDKTTLLAYPCAKTDKSYTIPKTVKIAPFGNNNPYLETLRVPEKTTSFADQMYCEGVEKGNSGLKGFTALKEIKIDDKNPMFKSIDGAAYTKLVDTYTLSIYPMNKSEEVYVLPKGTVYISAVDYLRDHPYLKTIALDANDEQLEYLNVKNREGELCISFNEQLYKFPNIEVVTE